MKSWKVEAAIIAVGLLLLGIMVKGGINNFVNMNYARLEAASILVVLFVGAFVLIGMYLAKKRNTQESAGSGGRRSLGRQTILCVGYSGNT